MFYCHQAVAVVADRRRRFCDGCEETVATDRSLASASQTVLQMDYHLIGCHANPANNRFDDQLPRDDDRMIRAHSM